MPLSIQIVTDKPGRLQPGYLIAALAWHWTRAGHQVTSRAVGAIDADLGILHIDRTRVEPGMIPPKPARCPLLNERVLDISKSGFSTLRVGPDDSWDGPVIVKSDLNCFGLPEWKSRRHGLFERKRRQLAETSWRLARTLPPRRYPVLAGLSHVPRWVWDRPDTIVERFMPEREGDLYCLRGWVFFGKRGYTYKVLSRDSMVKTTTMTRHEFLGDPPAELEAFREARGFDFGKFDYVEVDGRPILIDINKTPKMLSLRSTPDTPRTRHLAAGLHDFLGLP